MYRIKLTGINSKGKNKVLMIPITPESIRYSTEGRYEEYDIMNLGPVNIPNGSNLYELSWESFLPTKKIMPTLPCFNRKDSPESIDSTLRNWNLNGKILNVRVIGSNLNFECVISSYSSDRNSTKIDYQITLTRYRYFKKSRTSSKKKKAKKVKVKKGMTLYKLAKKYYGNSKKASVIYKANKKVIDKRNKKEKKKHPKKKISKYTIYPGMTLTIPAKESKSIKNKRVLKLKKALKADGYGKPVLNQKYDNVMKAAMKKVKIRKGKKGKVVKFVQAYVGVKQTGVCNDKTVKAIKTYQRKKKLKVTGVANFDTLYAMIK